MRGSASQHSNRPHLTVDVIVESSEGRVVLVERRYEPKGWALPGGFVEYGEKTEDAACREIYEETGLEVELFALLGVYSDPERDPRQHSVTTVYLARSPQENLRAGDDALNAAFFSLDSLPEPICFDHAKILADYLRWKKEGRQPLPQNSKDFSLKASEE